MSEMVERVAAILWHESGLDDAPDRMSWQQAIDAADQYVPLTRSLARKVIEAMREPTEAMRSRVGGFPIVPWERGALSSQDCTILYQAMIDEALK